MAKHFSVHAFGSAMLFRVPDDADMDKFTLSSIRSRKDVQRQLDDFLREQEFDPNDYYKW